MAVGGPRNTLAPPTRPWELHRTAGSKFGVQPSGPVGNIPRIGLPSSEKLDYAHKFTSTTILIAGAIGFLLFGPKSVAGKVRSLTRKHVGAA